MLLIDWNLSEGLFDNCNKAYFPIPEIVIIFLVRTEVNRDQNEEYQKVMANSTFNLGEALKTARTFVVPYVSKLRDMG